MNKWLWTSLIVASLPSVALGQYYYDDDELGAYQGEDAYEEQRDQDVNEDWYEDFWYDLEGEDAYDYEYGYYDYDEYYEAYDDTWDRYYGDDGFYGDEPLETGFEEEQYEWEYEPLERGWDLESRFEE